MGRSGSRRIHLLDELRGFTVILMVFFHAFYVIGYFFDVAFFRSAYSFFLPSQPFFAGVFVLICGISCNLSHSNLKRGLFLAAASAVLSLVMWCGVFWGLLSEDSYIWFGILHCLAVSILLYVLLRPTLRLLPPWLGVLLSAALFVLCYHVPWDVGGYFGISGLFTIPVPDAMPNTPWLYPLGLCPVYNTADYFPLLPWFFCFLAGTYIGVWAKKGKFPKFCYRRHIPVLSTVGKYTLWIYLLHQPVIYGLCLLVDLIVTRLF